MRQKYQDVIKVEIENIFGRSIISQRDCLDLGAEIFRKTEKQINVNTLRRFFGLVKSEYPPSNLTLNILSEYCGFQSAQEAFEIRQTADIHQLNGEENLVHYFVSMFEKIIVYDRCDKTFLTIVQETIKFLDRHPGLVRKFHSMVAKTKNGQEYYFEQFVNIDKFNAYYRDGLRYYMVEKNSNEAAIFGHSVLVFNYWLNKADAKLREHHQQLIKFSPNGYLNGYVYSRYFSALFYESHAESRPVDDLLVTLYKYYISLESATEADQLFYFEYVIAEALVLTGHYNDALFYLEQFFKRSIKVPACGQKMSLQNLKLFQTFALYKTGNQEHALRVFTELRPTDFHFIGKNHAVILHLHLTTQLKKKSGDYSESYEVLIRQSGFARLRDLFPLNV